MFVNRAPKPLAVIPFYVTAALFFWALCLMLFISAKQLSGHHFNPHILAIAHAAALGWGTMIIFGAVYQLLPVICEGNLYSPRLAFCSFVTLLSGTTLLVVCFWLFLTGSWMVAAGSIIVFSACSYIFNICATVRSASKSTPYQYFIVSSAVWFLLTTVAGLLLAINLHHTFIPRNHLEMLKLHAHAGIVGWFLQLICGVSAKLVPMFLLGKSKKSGLLYAGLILQNLGLVLFIIHGYFRQIDQFVLLHIALIVVGILLWALYIRTSLINRIRKNIDLLMKQTLYALWIIVPAVSVLVTTFFVRGTKWVMLYGTLVFLGCISGVIIAQTFKTLPFIVWNNRYKNVHGSAHIPLPKNLYREDLMKWQFYVFFVAVGALPLAIIANHPILMKIAAACWVALSSLYCFNVGMVVLHKSKV